MNIDLDVEINVPPEMTTRQIEEALLNRIGPDGVWWVMDLDASIESFDLEVTV